MSIDNTEYRSQSRIWDAECGIAFGSTFLAVFGPLLFIETVNLVTGASRTDSQNIVSIMDNQMKQFGIDYPLNTRLAVEIGMTAYGLGSLVGSHAKLTAETLAQRLRESQR